MKIMKSFFLLALMAVSFTLSASNDPEKLQVKSEVAEGKSILVKLFNLQENTTKVTIESLDGETTYFQDIIHKHNGYSCKLQLDQMPNGRYIMQVKQGNTIKRQVILIRSNDVQLSSVRG